MKTFLSIGTGPGIGLATAERFAAEGFDTILSSRDPVRLEACAESLRSRYGRCDTAKVDVSDAASIETLIRSAIDHHGKIDVLHYNVASLRRMTIVDQPTDTFIQDLAVNIGGAMIAIQAVTLSMFERGRGTILLTGGRFGSMPVPDYISLSVGKAGIRALALGLFEPFANRGVHVGVLTVAGPVEPASETADGIAEQFWRLHSAERDAWVSEMIYP